LVLENLALRQQLTAIKRAATLHDLRRWISALQRRALATNRVLMGEGDARQPAPSGAQRQISRSSAKS